MTVGGDSPSKTLFSGKDHLTGGPFASTREAPRPGLCQKTWGQGHTGLRSWVFSENQTRGARCPVILHSLCLPPLGCPLIRLSVPPPYSPLPPCSRHLPVSVPTHARPLPDQRSWQGLPREAGVGKGRIGPQKFTFSLKLLFEGLGFPQSFVI